MISIVVCSIDKTAFAALEQNIAETIGVPFELIRIDNSRNEHSICSAYNTGAQRSRYELLCFAHEDIRMITKNWGQVLVNIFASDSGLGLLGVAGTTYKTFSQSGWDAVASCNYFNLVQHNKYSGAPAFALYSNPGKKNFVPVTCVDGVWMCTRKHIALDIRFDQQTFKGFHCYDLDFSLAVFGHYGVAVTFDILLEHFSEGRNDRAWVEETVKLHRKWKAQLPAILKTEPPVDCNFEETKAFIVFIRLMLELGLSAFDMFRIIYYNTNNRHIKLGNLLRTSLLVSKRVIKRSLAGLRPRKAGLNRN